MKNFILGVLLTYSVFCTVALGKQVQKILDYKNIIRKFNNLTTKELEALAIEQSKKMKQPKKEELN